MELRPQSEKHQKARRDQYRALTGHIDIYGERPVIHEVQRKTGIAPPSWFKTTGPTVSDVAAQALAARGRKT